MTEIERLRHLHGHLRRILTRSQNWGPEATVDELRKMCGPLVLSGEAEAAQRRKERDVDGLELDEIRVEMEAFGGLTLTPTPGDHFGPYVATVGGKPYRYYGARPLDAARACLDNCRKLAKWDEKYAEHAKDCD